MSNPETGFRYNGVDLSGLFQPLSLGTQSSTVTGYKIKTSGQDLNQIFAALSSGTALGYDVGYKVGGIDLNGIFAKYNPVQYSYTGGALTNNISGYTTVLTYNNSGTFNLSVAKRVYYFAVGAGGAGGSSITKIMFIGSVGFVPYTARGGGGGGGLTRSGYFDGPANTTYTITRGLSGGIGTHTKITCNENSGIISLLANGGTNGANATDPNPGFGSIYPVAGIGGNTIQGLTVKHTGSTQGSNGAGGNGAGDSGNGTTTSPGPGTVFNSVTYGAGGYGNTTSTIPSNRGTGGNSGNLGSSGIVILYFN